jgi:Peptidase M60, enhancin and enhancin-like
MGALTEEAKTDMWNSYLNHNKSFKFWGEEPFLALSMYVQLKEVYGWEAYQNVFRAYQSIPPEALPHNEAEKRDMWLKMFSETVGEDLSDFFDAWNVPVS